MDYLMQYKEKKQSGTMSLPRKSVLKSSVTTARLPPSKPKTEAKSESGRRSVISETFSTSLGQMQGQQKAATAKIAVSSRKK